VPTAATTDRLAMIGNRDGVVRVCGSRRPRLKGHHVDLSTVGNGHLLPHFSTILVLCGTSAAGRISLA